MTISPNTAYSPSSHTLSTLVYPKSTNEEGLKVSPTLTERRFFSFSSDSSEVESHTVLPRSTPKSSAVSSK